MKLLDRLLGKVARDVTVATSVVKAIEKVAPPPLKYHTGLYLYYGEKYTNNWEFGWSVESDEPINGVWNNFLKWYHGRPKSRTYTFRNEKESIMLRREDIRRFDIKYWRGP